MTRDVACTMHAKQAMGLIVALVPPLYTISRLLWGAPI